MQLSDKATHRVAAIFERAQLGDPRRVRRAMSLTESLARQPKSSLPTAWRTQAELEAGYRFLRNPHTGYEELMAAIQTTSREEVLKTKRVVVVHDTTDVTCPSATPTEVGFLQTGQAGFFVHHALGLDEADGRPLGVLWSQLWGRAQRSRGRGRNRAGTELAKQKERESDRWLEGAAEAQAWTEGCQQVVHVMDREADSYRLLAEMDRLGADYVIRMRHNRRTASGKLFDTLEGKRVRTTRHVWLSPRTAKSTPRSTYKGRPAREAILDVVAAATHFEAPRYVAAESLRVNVVRVRERAAPEGARPVEWLLATTLPVRTRTDLERVIDIYRARWIIEEFHKALKTGCMLEKRQLESFESITTLLALSYPLACELLRVRTRARDAHLRASALLRRSQLECLRAHPDTVTLSRDPSAQEALEVIAGLGGHIRNNGPPGWQTLANGYRELLAFEAGWLAAKAHQEL